MLDVACLHSTSVSQRAAAELLGSHEIKAEGKRLSEIVDELMDASLING